MRRYQLIQIELSVGIKVALDQVIPLLRRVLSISLEAGGCSSLINLVRPVLLAFLGLVLVAQAFPSFYLQSLILFPFNVVFHAGVAALVWKPVGERAVVHADLLAGVLDA